MSGHLVCDVCGHAGGVRKRRCPYGYCKPTAICPACWEKPEIKKMMSKEKHQDCKAYAEKWEKTKQRESEILQSGAFVRCSALNHKTYGVHVIFRNKDGQEIGKYMSKDTYHALPYGEPFTVEDYAKVGELIDAPNNFDVAAA